MSLLTVIQSTCARLSLPIPNSVIGTTSETTKQLLYLAQQQGRSLSRLAAWKSLTTEKVFSATAAETQVGALPSDLDWIIPATMFNRTFKRRVDGPLSQEEWQLIHASLATMVDPVFRIRGTSLLIYPVPTAGDSIAYEYVTKNWCQSSEGVGQSAWTADSDTAVLDEELHVLGLLWRFKRAKGLDFGQEIAEYQIEIKQAGMREGVRPVLSTDMPGSSENGADFLAGAKPDGLVTENGDFIGWD